MADAPKLPPPSLDVLVQVIAAPALVHLGVVANPATGKLEKNLEQARWTIDLLHVLEEKVRASATQEERARLDAMLHQLRSICAGASK
ncbi:MAG: hypothetical protein HMLKMBBP_02662 [Planctomycetes bacterium]|nr:hypothetical protein [Planctomycetota bacterium]